MKHSFTVVTQPSDSDFEMLAKLHAASFPVAWSQEALQSMLAINGTFAVMAGKAGFAIVRCQFETAEILTLVVNPDERKQGVGRALVEKVCHVAREQGSGMLFLEVRERNSAAQALYKATGFTERSRRKGYYSNKDGTSEDACIMSKIL